mgnify:CR=1 FL=1
MRKKNLEAARIRSKRHYWKHRDQLLAAQRGNPKTARRRAVRYLANREKILAQQKLYSQSHREARLAYKRNYYATHREKWIVRLNPRMKESMKRYRLRHRDKLLASLRENYIRNREKRLEYAKQYRKTDRGLAAQQRGLAKRRSAIALSRDQLTAGEWRTILAAYNHRCAYCGKSKDALEQDHYLPISKGGLHTADNVVPACRTCNAKKYTRYPDKLF